MGTICPTHGAHNHQRCITDEIIRIVAEAVAVERESCAGIADSFAATNWSGKDADTSPEAIATAIRARSKE